MSVPESNAPDSNASSPAPSAPGLGLRLIAVVLILVGSLDMMLSWRGSFEVSTFFIAIFCSGVVLFGAGSVLAVKGRTPPPADKAGSV